MHLFLATTLLLSVGEPNPAPAAAGKERLVCKREVPIGSLISRRKICLTKAQWEKRSLDGNEEARKQAYDNMGKPSCNARGSC